MHVALQYATKFNQELNHMYGGWEVHIHNDALFYLVQIVDGCEQEHFI